MKAEDVKKIQDMPHLQTLAKAVFMAMAYTQTVRETIEPKQQEVIDFYKFKVDQQWRDIEVGTIITNHKQLYLAHPDDWQLFQREMDKKYVEVNLIPTKPGNCPLLEAESLERDTKRYFIDGLEPYTGLSFDRLISSGLDNYRKYIDLNLTIFASKVSKTIKP